MKETRGNLWNLVADLRVITTNGSLSKHNFAVMGRGCALEAAQKYPEFPEKLGASLQVHGNVPLMFRFDSEVICTLPVKHTWVKTAGIELIEESIKRLCTLVDNYNFKNVVMPRPGCGNGRLLWENVKPIIEPYLDDRFTVVTF